jgi:hypothetical protein
LHEPISTTHDASADRKVVCGGSAFGARPTNRGETMGVVEG